MSLPLFRNNLCARPAGWRVLLLAPLLMCMAMLLPQTAQACLSTPGGGNVYYVSCSELQDGGGAGSIAAPAGVVAGDNLILTVVTDGSRTITAGPTTTNVTWTLLNQGSDSTNTLTYFIYSGTVTGAIGTTAVTVSGTTIDWLGTIMRFTGSSGVDPTEFAVTQGTTATQTTPAPALTTALNNSLLLRMGGFDANSFAARDAAGVMTGYNTISQWSTADFLVSTAHVWLNIPTATTTAALDFATIPNANQEWRTASLALRPYYMCNNSSTGFSTGPVHFEGCAETGAYGNNTSITIAKPTGAVTGADYLVAVVTVDGNVTANMAAPVGWTEIDEGLDNASATTTAIYGRFADASATYNFSWAGGGNQEAFGYIMRFSGASGVVTETAAALTGAGTNVSTPVVTTTVPNSAVVRIGGFDNALITLKPTTIMTGLLNITQGRSSGSTTESASGAAVWVNQIAAGGSGTVNFTGGAPSGAEDTRRYTIALPPYRMCSGAGGPASGGIIEYGGCEQVTSSNTTAITALTPSSTVIGDYLIAVVATDGNTSANIAAPVGWTALDVGTAAGNAATLAVYGRFAAAAGAQNHIFDWAAAGAQDAYAYIMRYTNVDSFNVADIANATGTGTSAVTPAFNTAVANTMVVRVGAFDNGLVTINPSSVPTVITAHNNITQGRSKANPADAVSSSAAWINQALPGTTNTAAFGSAPTASEEWRAVTLGLRPKPSHFRITHDAAATVCAPETITITRNTGTGAIDTTYTGTLTISTSTGVGSWALSLGNGTLTNNPSNNGTATYQFALADAGSVTLQLLHTSAGSVNINLIDGAVVESASFDPALTVSANCADSALLFDMDCSATSNTLNTSNLPTGANRMVLVTVHRTANIGNPPANGTMTYGGVAMTLLQEAEINNAGTDLQTQLWILRDSSLPVGTGPFTVTAQNTATTRLCVFVYQGLDQTPANPTAPELANTVEDAVGLDTQTSVTTQVDDSLVLSAVTGYLPSGTRNWTPLDSDMAERKFQGNNGTLSMGVATGIKAVAGSITVTETHDGANTNRRGQVLAAFRPARVINHFRISHAGSGGTCGRNAVTFTAIDQFGDVLTSYNGTITLSAEGVGDWYQGTAQAAPANATADDGIATYTFQPLDNGVITLEYEDNNADTSKDFGATAGAITVSAFYDPTMNLGACTFRITHVGANGSTCQPNSVTVGVYNSAGALMTSYAGAVTLTAGAVAPGNGDWGQGDAVGGSFSNGTANDGQATYTFVAGDLGQVTFTFTKTAASTVNFNATAAGLTVDGAYDADLILTNCLFRITHDANGDVCTPEAITFTVVNGTGVTQTAYTGAMNLTTSTTVGDWSKTTAVGVLSNTGSGAATFTFDDTDNGVAVLYLMHHATSAGVNINANAGSFQEDAAYDALLPVVGCKIRFSFVDGTATTCTTATLTLAVYNSANTLAVDYTGQVSLSVSTSHGTWVSENGSGTLVDGGNSNGNGTYTFNTLDDGDVDLVFTSDDAETINFNATANSGAITVDTFDGPDVDMDPDYDPNLTITGCLPAVSDINCYANQSQLNAITLPSSAATFASRMVLMYVGSTSLTNTTAATIEGVAMTLLRTETNSNAPGTKLHVYGILDANLPAAAGDVDAAFTGSANSPAMCIVALENVAQQFPLEDSPAADGQLNGTSNTVTDPIITPLTTNENNSIVIGVALNSQGGTTYTSNLATNLWQAGAADPATADWAGFYGHQLAAGALNVQSDASAAINRQVQIALAIGPKVTGPPAVTGYVPVTLYQTFSGNVNYRSIGNTLRTQSNAGDACAMQPLATGSTAVLTIPSGSTITAAYLYWAGSGFVGDADSAVTFGVDGSTSNITADQVFIIEPDLPTVPEGFFAAYKNVTGLISTGTSVTYRFSNLSVRQDSPWDGFQTCLGGWALVVVYQNSSEPLNVINLFHGFQPFYNSNFTLVPRNFRMATPDGVAGEPAIPHGQVTHITFEGDSTITGVDEVIGLQNDPNALTFTNLTNTGNPANDQYNSSVTYPNYNINLEWTGAYTSLTNSYGTDVDTFYVEGDTVGELIYPFGALEAEQITTRYSTSGDYVLLVGEFISVSNAPIADLEVFVTDGGTWKVNSNATASYTYTVTNNGNGAVSGGFASGDVILTGNLPNGITIDNISALGWDCALQTATAFTCVFEIDTENVGSVTDGELDMGESLPNVVVTVDIGTDAVFTLLQNEITTVARMAHVGNYYLPSCQGQGAAAGVQPNPNPATGCTKSPQFDNVNDLNKYLVDIDDLDEKSGTNNNVHSNTRNVTGIQTNLSMNKALSGIMEANEPAVYLLTVSNGGPDATTKTVTVTDTLPNGLVPVTAVGTDWSCNIVVQLVTCTRTNAFPIANGGSAPVITITTANIVSPAVEGAFVSNTATVSAGTYNFDTVPANNSDTEITEVTGPLAAATEKFLISATEDGTTLGGLTFDDGDLILYDPVAGTATMFLDASALAGGDTLNDIDAVHLLPNGHIIMSTTTDGAVIGGVTFNAEDLVLYDPMLGVATLIFDGSAIFASDTSDIDSVHVNYNNSYNPVDWDIIISTSATATIGGLTFQDNDIVSYDVSGSAATLLKDGADDDLFNGAGGDISSLYVRYNDANKYILSSSDASTVIGTSGEQLTIENGELAELDLTTADDPMTDPLLCDNTIPCVGSPAAIFTPASGTRRLDAMSMIESGYFGHFAITSAGGDTCTATSFTIRKHAGLGHTTETHYRGSIIVSNNLGQGTWAKDVTANGTLTDLGGGQARYTFVAADNGQAILYITGTAATNSFNVNIRSNVTGLTTVTSENTPTEDPSVVISNQVTAITYGDNFGAVAYTNNDGNAGFNGAWSETNDDGAASTGKVRITTNQLRFNNLGGGEPSLLRQIDFSAYTVGTTPTLSFSYTISGSPSGTFVAEARDSNVDPTWTQLWSTSASSGSGTSGLLALTGVTLTATTQIRFRIASGYSSNATEFIFIDNVVVATETYDCGAGNAVDHYSVTASGTMISCLATNVTITPHTITELVADPGAGVILTLNTTTAKGFWGPPTGGSGTFNAGSGNGQATYVYLIGENTLTFPFYYTDLDELDGTPNSESFSFTVTDTNVPTKSNKVAETQTITVSRSGLRFFNETTNNEEFPTLVSGMRSNVFSNNVLTIQAVKTSETDPTVCEAAFAAPTTKNVELAFECASPNTCDAGVYPVTVTQGGGTNPVTVEPQNDNGTAGISGAYTTMPLQFTSGAGFSRAVIELNYADAGSLQIHGRHNIIVQDQTGAPIPAGNDYMMGSGDTFVVRPFAFDIDFTVDPDGPGGSAAFQDRATRGDVADALSWAANAADNNSAPPAGDPTYFAKAGVGFSTTVRAVSWQGADDANNDGVPDAGADLYNNTATPNFGKETTDQDNVTVTHVLNAIMPMGSVAGSLTDNTFTSFSGSGAQTHSMTYSEVGIIDLTATLDSGSYLGAVGANITGTVTNVGRFIPDHFFLGVPTLTARPALTPSGGSFSYLGEPFAISYTLTARNAANGTTRNYIGDFAKFRTAPTQNFYAVDDDAGAADVNFTNFGSSSTQCNGTNSTLRLCQATGFNIDTSGDWTGHPDGNGVRTFTGRLILARQLGQAPEGPFDGPADNILIGVKVTDSDTVTDLLNVSRIDLDDSADDATDFQYNQIGVMQFRYGRISLQNGYGPDIPDYWDHDNNDGTAEVLYGHDVAVRLVAEYWDGTKFIPNTLDIATPYDASQLSIVPNTFTDALADAQGGAAEPTITAGTGKIYQGETMETSGQTDTPLYLRAPLTAGNQGGLIVELNLDALGLSFLKFDWRDGTGAGQDAEADVKADPNVYEPTDNPRAYMEFGQFRGNDRIINWQEIFL